MRVLTLLFALICSISYSQTEIQYWVSFKDKNNTPYSVNTPLEYLSQRSIDRRTRQNIAITTSDFPVNPDYVDQVKAKGAKIIKRSKWFNGIIVGIESSQSATIIAEIGQLSFVNETVKVNETTAKGPIGKGPEHKSLIKKEKGPKYAESDYGAALNQKCLSVCFPQIIPPLCDSSD